MNTPRGLITIDAAKVARLRQWVRRHKIQNDGNGLVDVWNKAKELWPTMGELRLSAVVESAFHNSKKRKK